jgi:hypothetical protein
LLPPISWNDLKAGIAQPIDDDPGRVFSVEDHCREIIVSKQVGENVLRAELTHRR